MRLFFRSLLYYVFRHAVCTDDGVIIKFRLDGNLFNIRSLLTKLAVDRIFELQCADYAALPIPSHSLQGLYRSLQRNIDIATLTKTYAYCRWTERQ